MANLLAAAAAPAARTARLEGTDAIKNAIMMDARVSCDKATDTGEYRNWILGRFRKKVANLAGDIKEATEQLAEVGLLKEDKDSKKKGRRVHYYKKVSWDVLTEEAKSEADRLQIPRTVFE